MTTRIKIRGIYSTALTKLVLDWGYAVSEPSPAIRDRFGLEPDGEAPHLEVMDREDLQGIHVMGRPEGVYQFLAFLQERLPDVILTGFTEEEDPADTARAQLEFPGGTKDALDRLRVYVTPTVEHHHRFKIIDARSLEHMEEELGRRPEQREILSRRLFSELILTPLQKSGIVRLEHVRPSGKPMRPREGVLVEVREEMIVFRRSFSSGRYDGLDIPIEPGDFGLTEIRDGSWYIRHSYFRKDGRLLGEYYNINTPVELYPYGARYLDLEVDVIRRNGEPPFVTDREKLALLAREGIIGSSLQTKAIFVSEQILRETGD